MADEVRSIASRPQSCITQIEQILSTLRADTYTIAEINDCGSQIASASEEQSMVTAKISQNIHSIEAMAQALLQNSLYPLESTQSLSAANQQLSAMVNKFKLTLSVTRLV